MAWEVASRAEAIQTALSESRLGFWSLREAARLLGISTQPLRDWIRLGHVERSGPRGQISRAKLQRLVEWLEAEAHPYDFRKRLGRLASRTRSAGPFQRLMSARFEWPKGCAALTPVELAKLTGCHPSLVVKAIHAGKLRARRRSCRRWEVTRQGWRRRALGTTPGRLVHSEEIP